MNSNLDDLPYTQPTENAGFLHTNYGDLDDGFAPTTTNPHASQQSYSNQETLAVSDFIQRSDSRTPRTVTGGADPTVAPEEPKYGDAKSTMGYYTGMFWATNDPN
jgi:hypothetical protein